MVNIVGNFFIFLFNNNFAHHFPISILDFWETWSVMCTIFMPRRESSDVISFFLSRWWFIMEMSKQFSATLRLKFLWKMRQISRREDSRRHH